MNYLKKIKTLFFILIVLLFFLIQPFTKLSFSERTNGKFLFSLHDAARIGNISLVKNVLEKGVDVNTFDAEGATALMVASINGHIEIAKLLIEKGADVNAKDIDGYTALNYASLFNNTDIVFSSPQPGWGLAF